MFTGDPATRQSLSFKNTLARSLLVFLCCGIGLGTWSLGYARPCMGDGPELANPSLVCGGGPLSPPNPPGVSVGFALSSAQSLEAPFTRPP